MMRSEYVKQAALGLADRFNPIMGGPGAPLKTIALFDSFAPSLMPRAAIHQGIAAGASVLAGELVGRGVDAAIRRFVPGSSPFAVRIGARAVVAAAGLAVSRIPESDDEPTAKASVRTAGDTADFVHAAYHFADVTDDQKKAVHDTLVQLELERGERIKQAKTQAKDDGTPKERTKRPPWLRDRTTLDADEPAIEITPGDAPGDIQ